MPPKNIGMSERKIRFTRGLLIIGSGITLIFLNQIYIGFAILVIGLIPFGTSITGSCPFYCATRKSTNNTNLEKIPLDT